QSTPVEQDGSGELGQSGPDRRPVERDVGEVALPRGRMTLSDANRRVRLGCLVPATVEEGPRRTESIRGQVAGHDLLPRGEGARVPGLGHRALESGRQLLVAAEPADRGQ